MDIVYVRGGPSRRQGLEQPPAAGDKLQGQGQGDESRPHETARRTWDVTITVNTNEAIQTTITDPFLESEYRSVFEHYLRDSDRPQWSAQSINMTLQEHDAGLSGLEERIREYRLGLLGELRLDASCMSPDCQVYVIETPPSSDNGGSSSSSSSSAGGAGIHCLAWELLEGVHVDCMLTPRMRVTRISDVPELPKLLRTRRLSYKPALPLANVQAEPAHDFRVLLVVARDFSRTGADRDPEPDLAQWPLMTVQKKLRSRMMLEVVRPGSREELEQHLQVRALQGVHFHLVHFDLHGRIMNDERGNQVPWLLFAKQSHSQRSHGYRVPQTHLAKAEDIAQVLGRYQIENVVLNACLSAYNHAGSGTSLAHIFLEHGVSNVSAMWFYVHFQTVSTYLSTFYDELLVQCKDFHLAAHRGRHAIKKTPTSRSGGRAYVDFFLCVNYTRIMPKTEEEQQGLLASPIGREPSPSPSARSQGSSTSNNSVKSFMSGVWKPPTPRLSDSFLLGGIGGGGDEPVMRMQLHLLELEYKLMTSRVVYASDLRNPASRLHDTIDQMVHMWLNTNLVDEVLYHRGKDFARSGLLSHGLRFWKQRSRAHAHAYAHAPLTSRLFPRPVRALRRTLHVVHDVDRVIAPGSMANTTRTDDMDRRRELAQDGLRRFAERLHDDGHSYLLFLGSEDAQWWRAYLQYLEGSEWWVNWPWSYTVHSRVMGT